MRLSNALGHYLELRVLGYQFPEPRGEDWDANWLMIGGDVANADGAWSFVDPALTTHDVDGVIGWLLALADGRLPPCTELDFTEPNLSFVSGAEHSLRVFFELESRPPWSRPGYAGLRDLFLDFDPTQQDLQGAAASLREDLDRFPPRGAWANRPRREFGYVSFPNAD
jgi:hypothetical protein